MSENVWVPTLASPIVATLGVTLLTVGFTVSMPNKLDAA